MRDGIREKELSDLGVQATVEHVDNGHLRVELDMLAFDELLRTDVRNEDYHDGFEEGSIAGYEAALEEIKALAPTAAAS